MSSARAKYAERQRGAASGESAITSNRSRPPLSATTKSARRGSYSRAEPETDPPNATHSTTTTPPGVGGPALFSALTTSAFASSSSLPPSLGATYMVDTAAHPELHSDSRIAQSKSQFNQSPKPAQTQAGSARSTRAAQSAAPTSAKASTSKLNDSGSASKPPSSRTTARRTPSARANKPAPAAAAATASQQPHSVFCTDSALLTPTSSSRPSAPSRRAATLDHFLASSTSTDGQQASSASAQAQAQAPPQQPLQATERVRGGVSVASKVPDVLSGLVSDARGGRAAESGGEDENEEEIEELEGATAYDSDSSRPPPPAAPSHPSVSASASTSALLPNQNQNQLVRAPSSSAEPALSHRSHQHQHQNPLQTQTQKPTQTQTPLTRSNLAAFETQVGELDAQLGAIRRSIAARRLQRWFRRHKQRDKAARAALRRLFDQRLQQSHDAEQRASADAGLDLEASALADRKEKLERKKRTSRIKVHVRRNFLLVSSSILADLLTDYPTTIYTGTVNTRIC